MKWGFMVVGLLFIWGVLHGCQRIFIGLPPMAGPRLNSITVNLQHPGNPGFVPPAESVPPLPAH